MSASSNSGMLKQGVRRQADEIEPDTVTAAWDLHSAWTTLAADHAGN